MAQEARPAEQGSLDSGSLNPRASRQGSLNPVTGVPCLAARWLSDPCGDACGLSNPESSDPCTVAGVPCLAARWSSDPVPATGGLSYPCLDARGLSDRESSDPDEIHVAKYDNK